MILPNLHWSTVLGLPSWAWAAVITPFVISLMAQSGKRPGRRNGDIYWLMPGIGMYLLVPIALTMLALFSVALVVALGAIVQEPKNALNWFLLLVSPFMIFASGAICCHTFFSRTGFCETGLVRRRFRRQVVFAWSDITEIKRHPFRGPLVYLKDGRKIAVWEYLRGFNDLVAKASAHGIVIDVSR